MLIINELHKLNEKDMAVSVSTVLQCLSGSVEVILRLRIGLASILKADFRFSSQDNSISLLLTNSESLGISEASVLNGFLIQLSTSLGNVLRGSLLFMDLLSDYGEVHNIVIPDSIKGQLIFRQKLSKAEKAEISTTLICHTHQKH